jgi:hypothetical protein
MNEQSDLHEEIIKSMIEYIKWHEKFEYDWSDESGIRARNALQRIKNLCQERRAQIMESRPEKKRLKKEKQKQERK